jgi:hypothetical protein
MLGEKLDNLRAEQRRVGGQTEVHLLPQFLRSSPRVVQRRLENRKVHQCFTAEERDVRGRVVARLAQREIDAGPGGLLAHELRLPPVLGVDNLVFAVLVTVGAAQIALIGDVDDQRLQRDRFERNDFDRSRSGRRIANRPYPAQFINGRAHLR